MEQSSVERQSLYPQRMIDRIDEEIDIVDRFERKLIQPVQLSEQERKDVLDFEDDLGKRFEKITDITVQKVTFYVEYFLTPDGRENFEKTTGIALSHVANERDIKKTIFLNRETLQQIKYDDLKSLAALSVKYYDERLLQQLCVYNDVSHTINITEASNPQGIDVLLTPEKLAGKIAELTAFKNDVKKVNASLSEKVQCDLAKKKIIELYRKKYNQVLTEYFFDSSLIVDMAQTIGEDLLTEEEKELLKMQRGMQNVQKNLSRRDKFIHGADINYIEGERVQISDTLKEFAEQISVEYERNEAEKYQKIVENGYDPEKVFAKNVSIEQITILINELLEMYDLKSSYGPETYDAKRSGAAPDDKWQFIAKDSYKSMSVKGKQKIIKSDTKNKDIYYTMTVVLGHEMGHVLQSVNSSKIPLRLFEKTKGDRSSVFAEGGAMMLQDHIAREIFGTGALGHPHYVRAMIKKMEGGNYIDCVKAFYDSSTRALLRKKALNQITNDDFEIQSTEQMRLAIDRAKRLFRHSADLSLSSSHLSKSKDTAYLEQIMLARRLQEKGLEKYLFFSGINLSTLTTLLELGLIDTEEIQTAQEHVFTIWDRIKDQYLLKEQKDASEETSLENT